MRAPSLGMNVVVLTKPNSTELRDGRVWAVWSESPNGYWLMRREGQGGGHRCLGRAARPAPAQGAGEPS